MIINAKTNLSWFFNLVGQGMPKILIALSIMLLIVSAFSCQKKIKGPENIPGKEKLEKFDQLISAITKELNIDNYSYAIVSNSNVLKLKENGIAADQEVPVGDVSNMLISTLLLQCSEKGKIDVNSLLSTYGIGGNIGNGQLKNLLSFTQNTTDQTINYDKDNFAMICHILENVEGENVSELANSNLKGKLKMKHSSIHNNDDVSGISSLNDLVQFSMAIDNHQLFKEDDTHDLMFRPVYLETGERTPSGLGCFVNVSDERKIIWSAGNTDEYSTFLLNSATDSLSLIMIAQSGRLNAPFGLRSGDLRNTPVYFAFEETVLENDSIDRAVNFYDDYPAIRHSIQSEIKSGNRDVVYDELLAYLKIAGVMQNHQRYDSLAGLYNEFFPKDIPLDKLFAVPVAKINATMDYVRYERSFSLNEATALSVFATAEFSKQMTRSPWEYDNVEMYFDLNHERSTNFQSNGDDRQYRFNYDYPTLTGNAPTFENIKLVQYDVSPHRFNFEIAIPWKTLFNSDSISPEVNKKIGFDIAIADNDDEVREGSLAWQSKLNETPWSNTSTYGTMILSNTAGQPSDTVCYALMTPSPVELDGKNKGEWNNAPRYAIDKEFMSGIKGPEDQSGWFQVQWDDTNLYFYIEIQDDVKRLLEASNDYGWITNANQDTVWIQTKENSMPAGGDKSNWYVYTTIPLEAGDYKLHYQTNQTHSYGLWTKERPDLSFYGIVLYGQAGSRQQAFLR